MTSGLGGLHLVDDVIFSSIATGAILLVAMAVAGSLTVLPALLVVIGRRVDGRRTRRGPRAHPHPLTGPGARAGTSVPRTVLGPSWCDHAYARRS